MKKNHHFSSPIRHTRTQNSLTFQKENTTFRKQNHRRTSITAIVPRRRRAFLSISSSSLLRVVHIHRRRRCSHPPLKMADPRIVNEPSIDAQPLAMQQGPLLLPPPEFIAEAHLDEPHASPSMQRKVVHRKKTVPSVEIPARKTRSKKQNASPIMKQKKKQLRKEEKDKDDSPVRVIRTKRRNDEDDSPVWELRSKRQNEDDSPVRELRSKRQNEPPIEKQKKQKLQKQEEDEETDEDHSPVREIRSKRRNKLPIAKQKLEKQEEDEVIIDDIKPSRIQYRSSLVSIVSLLHNVKFTEAQKQEIQKSPFATMLLAITESNLDEQSVKKYDHKSLELIQTYQKNQGKFYLGQKSVALTRDEIALIFGITSGTTRVLVPTLMKKPNTDFVNRNFMGTSKMNYALMRTRIEELIEMPSKGKKKKKQVGDEASKDLARMLTLYVLGTVFLRTTGPNFNWSYAPLVENLEECSTFAWSTYLTDYLIHELDTKCTNPWTVGGGIVALLYWLCEHVKIIEPSEPHVPRFMKWKINELDAKLSETPIKSFSQEMVINSPLQPTDEEKRLYTILAEEEQYA